MIKPALIALALLATPVAAQTNLLVNGDFMDGTYIATYGSYSNDAPIGWIPDFDWVVDAGFNHAGVGSIYMAISQLNQTFSDVTGTTYQLSLLLTVPWNTFGSFSATIGNNGFSFYRATSEPPQPPFYTAFENAFIFTGTGLDTLILSSFNRSADFEVSNVVIQAIPEPATWALLLFGFAFVGMRGIWPSSKTHG